MNLLQLASEVEEITRKVGNFISGEANKFNLDRVEHKGLNDLVSYVDKTAEEKLVTALKALLPEAGFITEEATTEQKEARHRWIIDPLDGTTNFIHGLPVYSISVALIEDSEPLLGVVHEINRDECFVAVKGKGATMNGTPISVSQATSLGESLLATGFPYYQFDALENYIDILRVFMHQTHGLRRMGSAAVDLAYVACGRFEGYFEYNLNAWDVAAGVLLVREAGGTVTNFAGGGNPIFDRQVIAGGEVHAEMLEVISSK
jgi:myo-inositol-1(or 4)-monophosphatase